MLRIIASIAMIVYSLGTSTTLHVFAMHHTHAHSHSSEAGMSDTVGCDENNQCMQTCKQIESEKIGYVHQAIAFMYIAASLQIPLSDFLPATEYQAVVPDTYAIPPQGYFAARRVGEIKLTI